MQQNESALSNPLFPSKDSVNTTCIHRLTSFKPHLVWVSTSCLGSRFPFTIRHYNGVDSVLRGLEHTAETGFLEKDLYCSHGGLHLSPQRGLVLAAFDSLWWSPGSNLIPPRCSAEMEKRFWLIIISWLGIVVFESHRNIKYAFFIILLLNYADFLIQPQKKKWVLTQSPRSFKGSICTSKPVLSAH